MHGPNTTYTICYQNPNTIYVHKVAQYELLCDSLVQVGSDPQVSNPPPTSNAVGLIHSNAGGMGVCAGSGAGIGVGHGVEEPNAKPQAIPSPVKSNKANTGGMVHGHVSGVGAANTAIGGANMAVGGVGEPNAGRVSVGTGDGYGRNFGSRYAVAAEGSGVSTGAGHIVGDGLGARVGAGASVGVTGQNWMGLPTGQNGADTIKWMGLPFSPLKKEHYDFSPKQTSLKLKHRLTGQSTKSYTTSSNKDVADKMRNITLNQKRNPCKKDKKPDEEGKMD